MTYLISVFFVYTKLDVIQISDRFHLIKGLSEVICKYIFQEFPVQVEIPLSYPEPIILFNRFYCHKEETMHGFFGTDSLNIRSSITKNNYEENFFITPFSISYTSSHNNSISSLLWLARRIKFPSSFI